MHEMSQTAPNPLELRRLVDELEYRPGWEAKLRQMDRGQGSVGYTLVITVDTVDSYRHDERRRVQHLMPVPPASFDRRSWTRWLLDQFLLVERHEACEFFTIAGVKPYAPSHGPGNDPYLVRELGTFADADTSFRGERNHPDELLEERNEAGVCACPLCPDPSHGGALG